LSSNLAKHKDRDADIRGTSLTDLGIKHGAELVLKLLPMKVTVVVKASKSNAVIETLVISPIEHIDSLRLLKKLIKKAVGKTALADAPGTSVKEQRLYLFDKKLKKSQKGGDLSLLELGITHGSELVLPLMPIEVTIQVYLSNETDQVEATIVLSSLDLFDTFESLQEMLETEFSKSKGLASVAGTSLDDQNLIFEGKELTSFLAQHKERDKKVRETTLRDLGIGHGAQLFLKLLPMQVTVLVKAPKNDTIYETITISSLSTRII